MGATRKGMEDEAELKDGCFYLDGGGKLWSLEPEWFDTQEGLQTTRQLLEYLQSHPQHCGDDTKGFIMILEALEKALTQASIRNLRFHLTPLT
jgi:hypothetical protein